VDSLKPFIDALSGFGAAGPVVGLLAWLFWQERVERKELTGKLIEQTAKAIEAENDMAQALNALAGKLGK